MEIKNRWLKIKNDGSITPEVSDLEALGNYNSASHIGKIEDVEAQDGAKYTFYFVPVDGMPGKVAVYSRKKNGSAQFVKLSFSSKENKGKGSSSVSVSVTIDKNDTMKAKLTDKPKMTGKGRETLTFKLGDPKSDALSKALSYPSIAYAREIAKNSATPLIEFEKVKFTDKVVKLAKNVKKAFSKTAVLVPLILVGVATAVVGTTEATLNNNPRNFFDHVQDQAVVERVVDDLNLGEKALPPVNGFVGAVYSVTDQTIVDASPLDVLKESGVIDKNAGINNWHGKKTYGKANSQALVQDIAMAYAMDVANAYAEAGQEVVSDEVKYPITVSQSNDSKTDGFKQILDCVRVKGEDGKLSKLTESQVNEIISNYQICWKSYANQLAEDALRADANAQASASAQASAEASAKSSIDSAVRSQHKAVTGDIVVDWQTGDFVAWSLDKNYQYNGHSEDLKGVEFSTGKAMKDGKEVNIAQAVEKAEIVESVKFEEAVKGLLAGKSKATIERNLADMKNGLQVKYNADQVDVYVETESMSFAKSGLEGFEEMTPTLHIACYKTNGAGALEYASDHVETARKLLHNPDSSADMELATAMSVLGLNSSVKGYTLTGVTDEKTK